MNAISNFDQSINHLGYHALYFRQSTKLSASPIVPMPKQRQEMFLELLQNCQSVRQILCLPSILLLNIKYLNLIELYQKEPQRTLAIILVALKLAGHTHFPLKNKDYNQMSAIYLLAQKQQAHFSKPFYWNFSFSYEPQWAYQHTIQDLLRYQIILPITLKEFLNAWNLIHAPSKNLPTSPAH